MVVRAYATVCGRTRRNVPRAICRRDSGSPLAQCDCASRGLLGPSRVGGASDRCRRFGVAGKLPERNEKDLLSRYLPGKTGPSQWR